MANLCFCLHGQSPKYKDDSPLPMTGNKLPVSDTLSKFIPYLLNFLIQVKSQATYRTMGEAPVRVLSYVSGVKTPQLQAHLRRALKSPSATLPARYKKLTAKSSKSSDYILRKVGPRFLYLAFP